jgi:hypothetical protein
MITLNSLIGKEFRRKKYGLSSWSDVICKVDFRVSFGTFKSQRDVRVLVKGEGPNWYDVHEIILTNMPENELAGLLYREVQALITEPSPKLPFKHNNMPRLETKTSRILSYSCGMPASVTEGTHLEEFPTGCYVEFTVEKLGNGSLNDWILTNVEGVSAGQTILIHIDY